MRNLISVIAVVAAQSAVADGCPVAPDHTAALDGLYAQVQRAPNEMIARNFSNKFWDLWLEAPDEPSQMMLDEALRAMRIGDYLRANNRLNTLVSYLSLIHI